MQQIKKRRFIRHWVSLAALFLAIYAVTASHAEEVPSLTQITHVGALHPVRRPQWFSAPDPKGGKPIRGLFWRYPSKEIPSKTTFYFPEYEAQLEFALQEDKSFRISDKLTSLPVGIDDVVDYSVIRRPATQPELLVSQFRQQRENWRRGADARVHEMRLNDHLEPETISGGEDSNLSILPFDTHSPDIEKSFAAYVKDLKDIADERHTKLFTDEDRKAKKIPVAGDIRAFRRDISSRQDFARMSGVADEKGNVWLTGIDRGVADNDNPQDYVWLLQSKNSGATWGERKFIGKGNFPEIVRAANGDLLVLLVHTTQFGFQGEWPEDVDRTPIGHGYFWPGRGILEVIRSTDSGKTWSKPQAVVESKLVIQSTSCLGADGKLWVAFVQSDPLVPDYRRASLWLTSSPDGGHTWSKATPITDGKYLDREPDMIFEDNKLKIAFSRSGKGINTDIWLAELSG